MTIVPALRRLKQEDFCQEFPGQPVPKQANKQTKTNKDQAWCCTLVIPAFRRIRQESFKLKQLELQSEFKNSLGLGKLTETTDLNKGELMNPRLTAQKPA